MINLWCKPKTICTDSYDLKTNQYKKNHHLSSLSLSLSLSLSNRQCICFIVRTFFS
ncbi:MAG: hypothetical protein J8272_00400 ['Prunus persica' phytoplasma PP2]|nr:hypothetical protein ['Prunus persica' phytoplasma PP2]